MILAGVHNHTCYGALVRLEPSHANGYFIGTFGELAECGQAAYVSNLPEPVVASAWEGRLEELRQYLRSGPLGRIAVDERCDVLIEKTRYGRLIVNPETFTELPVDTSFWERDASGLYVRGQAI